MAGLFGRAAAFARSPAGRRAIQQAKAYAQSEKGRKQVAAARERLAKRRPPGR